MTLTPVTGTARGAAVRPPEGAGTAASGGESFLAALAALSSLAATTDGERAEVSTPADDAAMAAEEAGAAEGAVVAAQVDPAFAMTPPAQIVIAAPPASHPSASAEAATPQPGGQTPVASGSAGAPALPPGAAAQAPAPGDAQADVVDTTPQDADAALPEPADRRRASLSLAAIERLRASGLTAEGTDRADASATTQPGGASAAVTRVGVSDGPPATAPPVATTQVTSAFVQGISTTSPGKGATSDAGEAGPGFAFGGHAGAHTPSGVHAPSPAPGFATLVHSLQTPDALPVETATQIVQAIRMQMMRDGGEAHIRLDPRQFGDMTVRIRVDHGQVTARVEADAPVVREWLQNNQHVLRQNLAGQHLTLDRLDVREPPASSDEQRRDGQPARDQDRSHQRGARRRRSETGELFEVVA